MGKTIIEHGQLVWRRDQATGAFVYAPDPSSRLLEAAELKTALDETAGEGLLSPVSLAPSPLGEELIFEAFPKETLASIRKPQDTAEFLVLAKGLTRALADLHTTGHLHNYICPDAVLCTGAGDFRLFRFEYLSPPGTDPHAAGELDDRYLPFTSPEGTGRTGNLLDVRSDLYSLGALFHYLLTGEAPFPGLEAATTVYHHLAVEPRSVAEINPDVPESISMLVQKLLSKQPEDRYQGCFGLLRDLDRLGQAELLEDGFLPGLEDRWVAFELPERLFGRDGESAALARAADQARAGSRAVALVRGEPGAGKSALVCDLGDDWHERSGGMFLMGKHDAVVRSPYQALFEALASFAGQVLDADEETQAGWRARILESSPVAARLFSELVPELATLMGDLPVLEALESSQRDSRFKLALHDIFASLAPDGQPVLLFLDDLQWADRASLDALDHLLSTGGVANVLLVGAYRKDGPESNPPLAAFLEGLEKTDVGCLEIELERLGTRDVHELLADTFEVHQATDDERSSIPDALASLVSDKSEGNPLFIHELLTSLGNDRAFWYDHRQGLWQWDLDVIVRKTVSGGVAALLQDKLAALSTTARQVLGHAACVGHSFRLHELLVAAAAERDRASETLDEAMALGLVFQTGTAEWIFAHDQLRESLRATLSNEETTLAHYRLGRSYMQATVNEGRDDLLFQAMDQLLLGERHIADQDAEDLIQTAFAAVAAAKASAAYASALTYLDAVRRYFPASGWQDRYEAMLAYELEYLETLFLNRRFDDAEAAIEDLLARAGSAVDRARVHRLRIDTYTFLLDYPAAVRAAHEGLADLGVRVPANRNVGLMVAIARTLWTERRVDLHHLQARPPINSETARAAMTLLFHVAPAAFLVDKKISALFGLKMFELMSRHGMDAYGLFGASFVALVHGAVLNNYERSWDIAVSLLGIREQYPATSYFQGHFLLGFTTVLLWTRTPYDELLPLIDEGFEHSRRAASVSYIGFYAEIHLQLDVYMGRSMKRLQERCAEYSGLARRLQFHELSVALDIVERFHHHLTQPRDAEVQGVALVAADHEIEQKLTVAVERGYYYIDYLVLALVFGDQVLGDRCLAALDALDEFTNTGHHRAEFLTYACLQRADMIAGGRSGASMTRLKRQRRELARLAEVGPDAHRHRLLLVDAELAVLNGHFIQAAVLYQQAIDACAEQRFPLLAGIVAQRAANAYLAVGLEKQHWDYLALALERFSEAGASARVGEVVAEHPELGGALAETSAIALTRRSLDADSVIRASRAVFEAVEMEALVGRLLSLSIETAGATRGRLFLDAGGEGLLLTVEGRLEAGEILTRNLSTPLTELDAAEDAVEVLQSVIDDGEPVLLSGAAAADATGNTARSVLCLPIEDRGQHRAILYLDNHLTSGAFTTERVAVLEVLLSMAAISLTNARLYAQQENALQLERSARERLTRLNAVKDEFLANTSHELRTPLNGMIGLADAMLADDDARLTRDARDNLRLIVGSGRRLANLVNDILDFSRIQKDELEIHPRPIDPEAMVSVVCRLLRAETARAGVALVNSVPAGISPVLVDENRFQQILFNLIGNAIKFTDEGGEVRIDAQVDERHVTLSVSDNGIGIAEEDLDAIFMAYEQADASAERRAGGTGLGLPLTRRLVEMHGGNLTVTSQLGVGSVFSFALPVANVPAEPLESVGVAHLAGDEDQPELEVRDIAPGVDTAYRVLIVDDEPVNLKVLENYLTTEGYFVTPATSGAQALKYLEEGLEVDLVLLDVMMPRMNGYETCRLIRRSRTPVDLPVVLLTAKNRVEDLEEGLASGANDYIPKPFSRQELLARMKTHLGLAKMSGAFSRFVPLEIVQFLNRDSILDVQLGDSVQTEMTVMFMDIRSYTALVEEMTPEETFGFLISYFQRIGPIIEDSGGLVNQYLGDGIMALFPGSPDDAVKAAIGVQQEIARFNEDRERDGQWTIEAGIGLHTGKVILGIIGDKYRRSGNVIADTVNLASRIEGLTKIYGACIAVSEETLAGVTAIETDGHRFLDEVRVKGRQRPVRVHEIYLGDAPRQAELKRAMRERFAEAVEHYREAEFERAGGIFAGIYAENPGDRAAHLFMERCQHYARTGAPFGWGGVEEMTEK